MAELCAMWSRSKYLVFVLILLTCSFAAYSQQRTDSGFVSQDIDERDGIPILIKHLPEWESVRQNSSITNNPADVRKVLGERAAFSGMEFLPGTEAAIAPYSAGKLLLIEYSSPQAASDAESRFQQALAGGQDGTIFRRIGNYNTLVFDAPDPAAAISLLDQIKYEKSVQWLGEDPFLLQKIERYIASTGRDVALSTVIFIVVVLATAIVIGILSGLIFFRIRESKRANRTRFSDAGGLTRLNLDDLAEPMRLE